MTSTFATHIPTIKATRLGQTTIFAGKKFTCIRIKVKGKYQLIWDKGRKLPFQPKSSPTPPTSPIPTSAPVPTPAPTLNYVEPEKIRIVISDSSEIAVGETKFFEAKDRYGATRTYIVYRSRENVIVMSDVCTHSGCAVKLIKNALVCPCHNSIFNATNGFVERGPASYNLDRYEVHEENEKVVIFD